LIFLAEGVGRGKFDISIFINPAHEEGSSLRLATRSALQTAVALPFVTDTLAKSLVQY
jgi:hypothetical protein